MGYSRFFPGGKDPHERAALTGVRKSSLRLLHEVGRNRIFVERVPAALVDTIRNRRGRQCVDFKALRLATSAVRATAIFGAERLSAGLRGLIKLQVHREN